MERKAPVLGPAGMSDMSEPPHFVLICGLPGSGKSTLATVLAERLAAQHLNSDRLRHELGGQGDYRQETIDRVYATLITRAEEAARAGHSVILDATFSSSRYRAQAAAAAQSAGRHLAIVRVVADEATILERVGRERAESEAGADIYHLLKGKFDPVAGPHLELASDGRDVAELASAVEAFLAGRAGG